MFGQAENDGLPLAKHGICWEKIVQKGYKLLLLGFVATGGITIIFI